MLWVGQYELRSEGGRLVYSRLVGGKGWDGIGEGWDWGRMGLVGFGQAN